MTKFCRFEARKNSPRSAPTLQRRDRPFFVILLILSLSLWGSVAGAQEAGTRKRWDAPALQAQKKNPIIVNEASLQAGRKIYFKRCAPCHGNTGNGDGPDAADLGIHPAKLSDPRIRGESDGALFWKISSGKKPMPDYGDRLSATDRWNAINFVRTLTGK